MKTQLSVPSPKLQALNSSPLNNSVILSEAERAKQSSAQSKDPMPAECSNRHIKAFSSTAAALLVLILVAIATAAAQDHPVALKGAKLLTVTHGTIENGTVVMQGGKITAVGSAVAIPAGAQIIDATGMTVYPGLIDSETHLGLTEISAEPMTNDLVEPSDEIMPHMHVYDAFHAESALIPVSRLNGITNAIVAPNSEDTLPGQDSFIQLAGRDSTEMLLVRDIAMPVNFTGDQRRNKGGFEKRKFPSTRMGLIAQMRQAFLDARDYEARWADYERKKSEAAAPANDKEKGKEKRPAPMAPKRDLKLEALLPYLDGKKTRMDKDIPFGVVIR